MLTNYSFFRRDLNITSFNTAGTAASCGEWLILSIIQFVSPSLVDFTSHEGQGSNGQVVGFASPLAELTEMYPSEPQKQKPLVVPPLKCSLSWIWSSNASNFISKMTTKWVTMSCTLFCYLFLGLSLQKASSHPKWQSVGSVQTQQWQRKSSDSNMQSSHIDS